MPLDAAATTRVATHQPAPRCCGIGAPRWAVVQTHPQAERWANSNLQRNGYRTYLPLVAVQRRDRTLPTLRHTVIVPLFARYLFVAHDNQAIWRPIRETPGVASVLNSGGQIQYARAGDVEAVRAAEAIRRSITPPGASWAPGIVLEVSGGPFRGHRGSLVAVRRDRAAILLVLFGVLRRVDVPLDNLVVASHGQNLPD
jgi:transcriptional antiterminator RfaH